MYPWGAGGRRIKHYAVDAKKDALRAKMLLPEHRQRYRKRQAMVEPVFSQLRGRQGLHRFRRKGLQGVKVEFALHTMGVQPGSGFSGSPFACLTSVVRA